LALYFFCFALFLIPLTIVIGVFGASFRLLRRLVTVGRANFFISTDRVRPGDTIEAHANVIGRSSRPLTIEAQLTCTMFDHRPHQLYASRRPMRAVEGGANQYAADLVVPAYALRTGRVGDFSPLADRTHRMLVVWTVDFEVLSARGTLLHRKSRAVEVPRGRRPKTHLRRMSLLAIDTFSSVRNDMLFNWLVHLAACDGPITPAERTLLYELLTEMDGMADMEEAGLRIERELQRRLVIDDTFLHRYVPMEARLEFYRALYGLALTDGPLQDQERAFLADALKNLGMTGDDVRTIEGEVARGAQAPDPEPT
jgi:uncharacterized tellurite resistance protein B-like protein